MVDPKHEACRDRFPRLTLFADILMSISSIRSVALRGRVSEGSKYVRGQV